MSRRVLLLEPDAVLGRVYQQALEQGGYSVDWRQTAQAAIHAIDEARPEVIILELQLAAHSGLEFLYELRSYGEWDSLPVIINSQVPPTEVSADLGQLERLGVAAYNYKPRTNLRDLLLAVERMLSPQNAPAA